METRSLLLEAQAAGFVIAGEPLAVDLADTIITSRDPVTDLIPDEQTCRLWWGLQRDRLPPAPPPPRAPTIELRESIRAILDAHIEGREPASAAIDHVNEVASGVSRTRRLLRSPAGWSAEETYDAGAGPRYRLALSVVAASLIDVLVGPESGRLRRCQNPVCSMLFVATDSRRRFCTQNLCANRTRVARHYRRHHLN